MLPIITSRVYTMSVPIIKVRGINNIASVPRNGIRNVGLNEIVQLKTNATPLNATNKGIRWTLTGVGSITQSGLFSSGEIGGTAFIQVVSQENDKIKSGLYIINVIIPLTGLGLTVGPKGTDIYRTFTKNTGTHVTPVFTPATATNKNVIYKSSNPRVVLVNSGGLIMAGPILGSATITVTSADKTNGVISASVTIRNLL